MVSTTPVRPAGISLRRARTRMDGGTPMTDGDLGSFDTRFERLTGHYRDAITRGDLKPGDRFPSARELAEIHGVGRTTAGRVHGTLISLGLIEHRPGIGTFVLAPAAGAGGSAPSQLEAAARTVVTAYDEWKPRSKPAALSAAVNELRSALGASRPGGEPTSQPSASRLGN
jgi:DNA-binding transcriptional regulator YhcF (GntR family)